MEYIEHIITSIKINYKTWIALFCSCLLLYPQNLILGIILYIICILQSYWAHRISHEKWAFFLNRAHIYHHENTDAMSHIVQVAIETVAVFSPFIFLYYILDIKETIYPLDPYVFIMFYIFYTSTHNINYGQIHVNDVHWKHHLDYNVNYGPDICDIVFNTKYPKNSIENTDHYLPNIIIGTLIALLIKYTYENSNEHNKDIIKKITFLTYCSIATFVGFYTFKQCFIDINKHFNKLKNEFDNNIQSILQKLFS